MATIKLLQQAFSLLAISSIFHATLSPDSHALTANAAAIPSPRPIKGSPFGLHAVGRASTAQIKDLNAKVVRLIVDWQRIEPEPGRYELKELDSAISTATENKVDLLITLRPINSWGGNTAADRKTRPGSSHRYSGYPKDMARWLKLAETLSARYTSSNIYWQVENEWLWQWTGSPQEYLQFLGQTVHVMRQVNPRIKIVLGAITGVNAMAVADGAGSGCIDLFDAQGRMQRLLTPQFTRTDQYKRARQATEFLLDKGQKYFDIVDFHTYCDDPYEIKTDVQWLRGQMSKYGYSKPIWSSENAGPFSDSLFSEENKSAQIVQRYVIAMNEGLERLFWSSLVPTTGWSNNFLRLSLIDTNNQYTPAYFTYRLTTSKLRGATSIQKISTPAEVEAYRLITNKGDVYVAWSTKGTTEWQLPAQLTDVEVTNIITQRGQDQPSVSVMKGAVTVGSAANASTGPGRITHPIVLSLSTPVFIQQVGRVRQ